MEKSQVPHKMFPLPVPLVYFFVALCLFGSLAEDIVEGESLSFDLPIQLFLHGHAAPALDSIMLVLTRVGSTYGLVPLSMLIFFLLMRWKRKSDAIFFAISVTGAALLNFAAKQGFARVRPDLWVSISPEVIFRPTTSTSAWNDRESFDHPRRILKLQPARIIRFPMSSLVKQGGRNVSINLKHLG